MDIPKLSGGKTFEVKPVDWVPPPHPVSRFGHPGTIAGNVDFGGYIRKATQLELGVPFVARLRGKIREFDSVVYLLLIPTKGDGPGTYKLSLRKNAPIIRGLQELFEEADIPIREDQWVLPTVQLVRDEDDKYAVALNWTEAATESRDILKERRIKSEAAKRRREQKKQAGKKPDGQPPGPSAATGD